MACRQEPAVEHVKSLHASDDDGTKAAASNTDSVSESGRARNGSNSADNEPHIPVESVSVEPTKTSGRRSGTRRNERYL